MTTSGHKEHIRLCIWACAFSCFLICPPSAMALHQIHVDRSFGQGGTADPALPPHYASGSFSEVEALGDGRIQATREFFEGGGRTVLHYEANGALDPSFPPQPAPEFSPPEVALEEGKFLVAKPDPLGRFEAQLLERLNSDRSLDTSFGTAGLSDTVPFTIEKIVVLSDGAIIVGGSGLYANQGKSRASIEQADLARFTADGRLDTSFGAGGVVHLRSAYGLEAPTVRRIVPVGSDLFIGADAALGGSGSFVAKLTADGTLDASYGSGGAIQRSASIIDLHLLPDEKLLVAGNQTDAPTEPCCSPRLSTFSISRYTASGQPDASFGTNGVETVKVGEGAIAHAVLWGEDGSALLAGGASVSSGPCTYLDLCEEVPVLARMTSDGQLDKGFDGGVVQLDQFPGPEASIYGQGGVVDLAPRTNNEAIAAGGSGGNAFLVAVGSDGNLDPSFGSAGIVSERFSLPNRAEVKDLTTDSSGRILVLGSTDAGGRTGLIGTGMVARYAKNGALDHTFGAEGGFVLLPGHPLQIAADRAERVTALTRESTLVTLTRRGRYDKSFGDEGLVFLKDTCGLAAEAMTVLPRGAIIVSGRAFTDHLEKGMAICKLRPDGSLDSSFGKKGRMQIRERPRLNGIRTMTVQADGRILLAGLVCGRASTKPFPATLALMRIMPRGGVDKSFGRKGHAILKVGPDSEATDVAVQDGNVLVAGTLHRDGRTVDVLASYDRNGHLRRGFGQAGIARAGIRRTGGNWHAETVEVLPTARHILLIQAGLSRPLFAFSRGGRLQRGLTRHIQVAPGRVGAPFFLSPHGTLEGRYAILGWNTFQPDGRGGMALRIALERLLVP